jgi:hypothetical protein
MTIPKIDLRTFIIQIIQGALVGVGEVADPDSGQKNTNLPMALYHVGVLELLYEKTQGNRSQEEEQLLSSVLTELREKVQNLSS